LNKTVTYLVLVFLLVACKSNKHDVGIEMPRLYPAPLTAKLNTEEGYKINQASGYSNVSHCREPGNRAAPVHAGGFLCA